MAIENSETDVSDARQRLWGLLGGAPSYAPSLRHAAVADSPWPDVVVEKLWLDLNGEEDAPAYFLRPARDGRFPLVLYGHGHGRNYDLGKEAILQGSGALLKPYGEDLVRRGYAVLTIDNWMFGERPRHGGESAFVKARLLAGEVVWGMMLRDNAAALDYACSRGDVDASRIAALGLSMGSSMAWWLSALDERIRVCVDLCCLTDFAEAIRTGGIDGHGFYYIVPGLLHSFDTHQINALIAPRPHLGLAGEHDPLTPRAGLDRIDAYLRAHYAALGARDAWELRRYNCGHEETPEMRAAVLAFLERWL